MILSLRDRMMAFGRLAGKLARDARGNTLAIVAAAIIPLAALIGGGVDMSRAYMAQSRLQLACDAAALAGRRAMTTGSVDSTVRTEALKFFRFNFPTGESSSTTPPYGVASFTPTVADGDDSAVVVTAATTVPTTIMGIFGYSSVPISVNCNAKQDFVNTDVMLVLDNTGSMRCLPTDSATTQCSTEKTGSKMAALREAVMALYNTLAPTQTLLESHGLRLRYGIVPYSGTVNIGNVLRAVNPIYVKSDNWDYQSRKYIPDGTYNTSTPYGSWNTTTNSTGSWINDSADSYNTTKSSKCNPPANSSTYGSTTTTAGVTTVDSATGVKTTPMTQQRSVNTTEYQATYNSSNNPSCKVEQRTVTGTQTRTGTQTETPNYVTNYQQYNYDISQYVQGAVVQVPVGTNGANVSSAVWKGCIEERQSSTTTTITSSTTSIPTDALDLDLKTLPTTSDPATQWKPYWPEVSYYRSANTTSSNSGSKSQTACPAEASRLKVWSSTTLQTYVNGLTGDGGTYSDVGMAWGGRLLSDTGVFASDNPSTYSNMPVARYLILMTDGYIDTGGNYYGAWGIEQNDRRASGSTYPGDTTDTNNHMQRFSLLCSAIKNMKVEIWVIGFGASVGSGLDSTLENCATDKNKAEAVADKDKLIAKFQEIGKDIGALRLTK